MKNLIFMFLFMLVGAFSVSAAIPKTEQPEFSKDFVQDFDVLKTIDSAVLDVQLVSESVSAEVQKESLVFENKYSEAAIEAARITDAKFNKRFEALFEEADRVFDSQFNYKIRAADNFENLYFNKNSISERKAKTKDNQASTEEQPYLII